MGYQVLITIDLPNTDSSLRDLFYEVLKKRSWYKVDNLTTTWKVFYPDAKDRASVISVVKSRLKEAQEASKVKRVVYAFQLAEENILEGELK